MLSTLRDQLAERGVDLYLVRVRWPVRTVLARSGLRAASVRTTSGTASRKGYGRRGASMGSAARGTRSWNLPNAAAEVIVAPTLLDENPANTEE